MGRLLGGQLRVDNDDQGGAGRLLGPHQGVQGEGEAGRPRPTRLHACRSTNLPGQLPLGDLDGDLPRVHPPGDQRGHHISSKIINKCSYRLTLIF